MKLRKIAALTLSAAMLAIAGCGNAPASTKTTDQTVAPTENADEKTTTAAPETTAAATTEAPAEDDTASDKPVILMVSFGTSFNDSRDKTIGAIENAVQAANPDYDVRRAFTSQIIIDKLKDRDNLVIDNVEEAFARLEADGVKDLTVQPTHVMSGFEYDDLMEVVKANADKFDSVKVGAPLLTSDTDYTNVIDAITVATSEYDDGNTAIVFMGHGTEHSSNATYAKLQNKLADAGKKNYFIGTVEAEPSLDDVVAAVKAGGYKRVVLEPLMVVAGDHANNDMAGDEDDSWKTVLTNEGFEVVTLIRGLGELDAVQSIYVDHVKNAAALSDTAAPADGEYSISTETDGSMFKIVDCKLTVADGKMTAVITLSGSGFSNLYMGTAADAEKADAGELIGFTENSEGQHVFTVPVEALDTPIKCAAQSAKKSTWYDHEITFKSDSIA